MQYSMLISMLAFVGLALANEAATNQVDDAHDIMGSLVDKFVNKLGDQSVTSPEKPSRSWFHRAGMPRRLQATASKNTVSSSFPPSSTGRRLLLKANATKGSRLLLKKDTGAGSSAVNLMEQPDAPAAKTESPLDASVASENPFNALSRVPEGQWDPSQSPSLAALMATGFFGLKKKADEAAIKKSVRSSPPKDIESAKGSVKEANVSPAYAKYIAEFIGTYLLVFTVGNNVLQGDPVWGATSIACMLMVAIYALGGVSGGNFNPAVSLTLAASGYLDLLTAFIYILVQVAGGVTGAYSYAALLGTVFKLGPAAGFTWWRAGVAELLYTFMLCFTVINTACSTITGNCPNQFYALAIGFSIIAGGYGAGLITGGCFNPAVSFGIDVSCVGGEFQRFGMSGIYAAFQLVGALLASLMHRLVRPREYAITRIPPLCSRVVSEFVGTFFLVLTVAFNVYGGSRAGAFSIAAALMVMIYALGNVSGGHFNPAVTTAVLLSGRGAMKGGALSALAYVCAQIAGGISAAITALFTLGQAAKGLYFGPPGSVEWGQVAVAEVMYTAVLSYVVLAVATTKKPSEDMFGWAIGSCVTAGGLAIGALSGGSLNPAVSFGLDTANAVKGGRWFNCLLYTCFELAGGIIAAGIFFVTHPLEYTGLRENLFRRKKSRK